MEDLYHCSKKLKNNEKLYSIYIYWELDMHLNSSNKIEIDYLVWTQKVFNQIFQKPSNNWISKRCI